MEVQNMKKAKRLLAVLMAAVMLFSAAYVPSYAWYADRASHNWHVPQESQDEKYWFNYDQGASWLLDQLDMMLADLGIMLTSDDLNDLAGFDVCSLIGLKGPLEDAGAMDEDPSVRVIDIRSVDMLIRTLSAVLDVLIVDKSFIVGLGNVLSLFGDLLDEDKGLQAAGLDATKLRSNEVIKDSQVLEMLILWISNQKALLKSLLAFDFNWGGLLAGLLPNLLGDMLDPVAITFSSNKLDISTLLKNLLYNLLIDSNTGTAPGGDIDAWVQQLINWALITGTGDGKNEDAKKLSPWGTDGASSLLGANHEPLFPAIGKQPGGAGLGSAAITVDRDGDGTADSGATMNFYQLVANLISALFDGTLKDLLYDLLIDLLGVEITAEFPQGNPAVLTDQTFSMIVGIVEGLFVDNGAPVPTYTDEENTYPVPKINALLDWLLVGELDENGNKVVKSALDTFITIDYYGLKIQDNFMSLLNDVARLLINLLPSLGLFEDSAHLAYSPDDLTVSWFVDADYNLVSSLEETKVTQTYVTYETNEIIYPTEYITDANGAQHPSAYCYLDTKAAVNTSDASNETTYRNPSLIRPNYVITTDMVFANIIKLAVNDFIDGCYFPEWTTDIPSVLAYAFAAMAAPILPENNYFARLDAYYELTQSGVAPVLADGTTLEPLYYYTDKVITIKDQNGNKTGTKQVRVPTAALSIISSYGAKMLNGVFHFDSDADKFTTDTTFEQFLCEFLMWAVNQYMPAFVGSYNSSSKSFVKDLSTSTNDPIFAGAMTTVVKAVYTDYANKVISPEANWDIVYELVDSTLFKLLPASWLPGIGGSAQFINEWLLNNLINFDLQGILGLLQVNPTGELSNSVVKVLINIIDRVTALLFNDNGVLITGDSNAAYNTSSTGDKYRANVVMGNKVTTISTLAGLLDAGSTSASLPMLVYNLLTLLNLYKFPILSTALPLLMSTTYIQPHDEDLWKSADGNYLKTYTIGALEGYLGMLNDNLNAIDTGITFGEFTNDAGVKFTAEEVANSAVDGKAMAVKNADGVRTDIQLSTGYIFGTYDTRDEAVNMINQLKDSYIVTEYNEQTKTDVYKLYTRKSYLIAATTKNVTTEYEKDGTNLGEYTEYGGFSYAMPTYRAENITKIGHPFVNYEKEVDDYRFFEYEDFGKAGYLYNNQNDADDGGYEFIDEYNSFAKGTLVDAYGDWYMYYIESELRRRDLFDENGDGKSVKNDQDGDYRASYTETDENGNALKDENGNDIINPGYPVDGNPGIPTSVYPFFADTGTNFPNTEQTFQYYDVDGGYSYAARNKQGWLDSETGTVITGVDPEFFTTENFEQIRIAYELGQNPENNVVLSDADAESIIRYILGTVDFDITLNSKGVISGSTNWTNLSETQWNTINTWISQNGFTLTTETLEDGTTAYRLARPAFRLIYAGDMTFYANEGTTEFNVSNTPTLKARTVMDWRRKAITKEKRTYGNEIELALHDSYYDYIEQVYRYRVRLIDEIDEISWRRESAETGRKTTVDTTVLKWVLDLTEKDYRDSETRKRNVISVKNPDTGKWEDSKAFTTSSYAAFRDAWDFGNSLYLQANGNTDALGLGVTQSMVSAAYYGILETWMALVEFTGFADWTQIDSYVKVAEEILADPYLTHPDFGVESGLDKLEAALKDAYVYTDYIGDTDYDLNPNSKINYDSEYQLDIDSAAALLNQAIQALVYRKLPGLLDDPESTVDDIKIQDTKYENQIQYAHIYGLTEGVGFGDGTMDVEDVLDLLGLKVKGMTLDGETNTIERTPAARGNGTDARLDGRYRYNLRFRYYAVLYGDLNGDTRIDGTDASALNIYIAKGENYAAIMGDAKFEAADVNHDSAVDNEDYDMIVKHYTLNNSADEDKIKQNAHSNVPTSVATFVADGVTVDTIEVNVGSCFSTIPTAPSKDGFTFSGWVDENGVMLTTSTKMTANDVTYTAEYVAITE
ncbi:MAG: hypothetical protein E7547_07715 [Ruminococcaceae bacterium]|nr:hypothetical protein [Oscillospiraceae bacterium]